jgi:selenophosphate synthetase-related protein
MHDHMEQSQTAAGGNYPQGAITDIVFVGDIDGQPFPNSPASASGTNRRGRN